ncbi:MAG: heavy-metal-associated domain-containing protein [Bacteroidales bacterium]|nr:heavy-metal-associated domain-containing protein [Bacteroidales bacterium]
MKKVTLFLIAVFFLGTAFAQNKKNDTKTVEISIPGYCCNGLTPTIEKTLAYERGVVEWTTNLEKKSVTVVYREGKTNPAKIEKALAANGVRTANEKPNPRAIEKLPACCQPAAKGESGCDKE